jgi:hypothetical protein
MELAMLKILIVLPALFAVSLSPALARQSCVEQVAGAVVKWDVTKGLVEAIEKGQRCLVFLQVDSKLFPGKRAAWLIEGKNGKLLAEFCAPTDGGACKDTDRGLCSFRTGRFPTSECAWSEWMDKASQM